LRIFHRKPLSVNRFFSSLIICVNLRTNELALPLLERLLSVPDQVNQPNCGITLSGSSPALAVTRTSGRFSGPEIDWQRCALNGGNLPPASVKQFKLRRVFQGNFLLEFRIALLLAAAPNERAKWQPSLPKLNFFACNFWPDCSLSQSITGRAPGKTCPMPLTKTKKPKGDYEK